MTPLKTFHNKICKNIVLFNAFEFLPRLAGPSAWRANISYNGSDKYIGSCCWTNLSGLLPPPPKTKFRPRSLIQVNFSIRSKDFEFKSFFFGIFFIQSHGRFSGVKNLVRSGRYLKKNNFVKFSTPRPLHSCNSSEPMSLQTQNKIRFFIYMDVKIIHLGSKATYISSNSNRTR